MTEKKKNKQEEPQEPEVVVEEQAEESAEDSLERALEQSREEARRNHDLYLRSRADFENFRKRMQREKEETLRFANENLLREILPVMDNLERAVEHAAEGEESGQGLLEGVQMTLSQLSKTLEKFGVTEVAGVGEPFDPAQHEAMGQVESSELEPNRVAQVMQKGYFLNQRLLRPALVLVAKAPAGEQPKGEESQ